MPSQAQPRLPLAHIDTTSVKGSVTLAGNDLRITPGSRAGRREGPG
jgi:hypothetical protein